MSCGFYSNYFLVDKALVQMYLLVLGLENYMGGVVCKPALFGQDLFSSCLDCSKDG